jgi:hypothetical protein
MVAGPEPIDPRSGDLFRRAPTSTLGPTMYEDPNIALLVWHLQRTADQRHRSHRQRHTSASSRSQGDRRISPHAAMAAVRHVAAMLAGKGPRP